MKIDPRIIQLMRDETRPARIRLALISLAVLLIVAGNVLLIVAFASGNEALRWWGDGCLILAILIALGLNTWPRKKQ